MARDIPAAEVDVTVDLDWLAAVGRTGDGGRDERPDYEGAVSGVSVGRWKEDLGADEQAEVERLCGPRLRELGYVA